MIKIIQGVYGHYTGKRVEPKDKHSDPFQLAPEQEQRLVEQGVAVFVDCGDSKLPDGEEAVLHYDKDTSVKELREIGKNLGLTFKFGTTKLDMIAALDSHISENTDNGAEKSETGTDEEASDEVQFGEPAPTFDPAEAVQ